MTHPTAPRQGVSRILAATRYSAMGLRAAWRHEAAFRQEALLALIALPCAAWLARTWVEFSLLFGSVVLVLVVELLNTAIEAVVDRIGPELHELSGRAKDVGSAAVLLMLGLAATLWLLALWARLGS